jgi:DNA-binding MarR family transcriptional regulator
MRPDERKENNMSEFATWFFEKSGEITRGIGAQTNPKIEEYIQQRGDLEDLDISFLQVGYGFAPDPITPQSYIARGPYTNPEIFKEQMDASVNRGWLVAGNNDTYQLSQKAVEVVEDFFDFGNGLFKAVSGLSKEENSRIADLLAKLVLHADGQPRPAGKPSLEIGRRLEPAPDADPMIRIRRYLTDMAYYREDVHTESWQSYKVSGILWETLTYIWRDEASNAVEIMEKVSEYRRYTESDYTAAFDELVSRGWATKDNGKFILTKEGKSVREEAEDLTDQLYAAPFAALKDAEIEELTGLMEKLAEVVSISEAESQPSG